MKNLRTYIVKALYPMCSEEVQILIDQMQNNSDKFTELFDDVPYRRDDPWAKALRGGSFELIDSVALRQQLKLLKGKYAKQLILEGLLKPNNIEEKREATLNMFDSILKTATQGKSSQPTKLVIPPEQLKAMKQMADSHAMSSRPAKRTAKARK